MKTTDKRVIDVLVVDDDEMVRALVKTFLGNADRYHVIEADCGKKGLKVVQKTPPDVILLDIMMPHISGFEVLRRLKHSVLSFTIPVIMLTGLDDRKSIKEAMGEYADHYIVKPFGQADLITAIERAVSA